MNWLLNNVHSLAIICVIGAFWLAVLRYERRLAQIDEVLDRIRVATYELTKTDREDIEDLQAALKAAGIEQPRAHYQERLRRIHLTPKQRERESIERFEQVVAETEKLWGYGD